MRLAGAVFTASLVLNLVAWYGGLRSPDAEVVFEQCRALHDRGSFAVEGESSWVGFGLAPGRDGRSYPVFGPAQAIACVPWLALARLVDGTRWYESVRPRPSHHVGDGLEQFLFDLSPTEPRRHAERTIASLLNVVVGALGAALFFALASRFASPLGALGATALYAAGSLAWPYAGTFFSEPLATAFVLASALSLARRGRGAELAGGLALGLAVAAHISAILFVPFWAAWAILGAPAGPARRRAALGFLLGAGVVLAALAAYNVARFGDPLETGRAVNDELARRYGYGEFVSPFRGLYGLTLSPGKGLLFFAPAVALGIGAWPSFRRRWPLEGLVWAATAVTRILFLASRSDWHGGFSLGPRLLVMLVPFLLLPVAPWLDALLARGRARALRLFAAFSVACIAQQAMFVVGEPFSFYHLTRFAAAARGEDPFVGDRIYLSFETSPIIDVLSWKRGSWLLSGVPLGNTAVWLLLAAILSAAWYGAARLAVRRLSAGQAAASKEAAGDEGSDEGNGGSAAQEPGKAARRTERRKTRGRDRAPRW